MQLCLGVASHHIGAFRRPPWAQWAIMECPDDPFQTLHIAQAITDQGQYPAGFQNPLSLGKEGGFVEPVKCLGNGDQVHTGIWQGKLMGLRRQKACG